MSFGFPASSTGSQTFNLGQRELLDVVSQAFSNLGWSYASPLPNQFLARISPGIWSWGEKMSVEISYNGNVTAKSECLLITQCLDWGKNGRNVRAFFNEVSRLASMHPSAKLPIAAYDDNKMTPVERVIKEGDRPSPDKPPSNNSFKQSGIGLSFISKIEGLVHCVSPG